MRYLNHYMFFLFYSISFSLGLKQIREAVFSSHPSLHANLIEKSTIQAAFSRLKTNPDPEIIFGMTLDQSAKVLLRQNLGASRFFSAYDQEMEISLKINEQQKEKIRRQLRLEIDKKYFLWQKICKIIKVEKNNLGLAKSFEAIMQTRYTHQNQKLDELLRLKLEISLIAENIRFLESDQKAIEEEIAILASQNIEMEETFYEPFSLELGEPDLTDFPEIRLLDLEEKKMDVKLDSEKSALKPVISLGLQSDFIDFFKDDPKKEDISVLAELSIPLGRKVYKRSVSVLKSKQNEIRIQAKAKDQEIRQKLASISENLQNIFRSYTQHKKYLIPLSTQNLMVLKSGYETGVSGYFLGVDQLRTHFQLQIREIELWGMWFEKKSEFDFFAGTEERM